MKKRILRPLVGIGLAVGSLVAIGGAPASAGGNTQVILSTTSLLVQYNGSDGPVGPAGFWLWSTDTTNAYGNGGQGSIYFYGVAPVRTVVPAEVDSVRISGGDVSEHVTAANDNIDCWLNATLQRPGKGLLTSLSCILSNTPYGTVSVGLPGGPEPITMQISNS